VASSQVLEPDAPAAASGAGAGHAATFASAEHFDLQTARALTVSEANRRASNHLAALSSTMIALAFIGQISRLGTAFYDFCQSVYTAALAPSEPGSLARLSSTTFHRRSAMRPTPGQHGS
jgi:hypothetical protein